MDKSIVNDLYQAAVVSVLAVHYSMLGKKFSNLKLNTRLPAKKIRKLDVCAFREEGKRFKSQIHLIIISGDC